MGEYIPASIQFGGQLKREHVRDLCELLEDKGMRGQDDGMEAAPGNLSQEFHSSEVNYGNLDELTTFAEEHGLEYRSWFDSGPDWVAAMSRRYADGTVDEMNGHSGDLSIQVSEIKKAFADDNGVRSYAAIDALLARIVRFEADLPPLEIVGEMPEVECSNCDWSGKEADLKPIEHIGERVAAGETMPAGECPECGCLAHLVDEE